VDAVVSNPPYSQKWDPENKENDPRYARFGLAPKTKADFAFLLHDLYHLKPDGIMTIGLRTITLTPSSAYLLTSSLVLASQL
jgi:type I restriction enzyme M protein